MNLVQAIEKMNVWKRGDQRAPHKPLLLLYVFGKYLEGHARFFEFSEIDEPLRKLLVDFGPARRTHHSELPFWHLASDGMWELRNIDLPKSTIGSASAKRKMLIGNRALGGLTSACYEQIKNPGTMRTAVQAILHTSFPETIHEDILSAVGLPPNENMPVGPRTARFRQDVLRAYQNKCAICGFSSRLGDILVGVEAAHIKWHQAGGPDDLPNGVALCSLHHKLFDRGIITISPDLKVSVSETATGTAIFDHIVVAFHGKDMRIPLRKAYYPFDGYLRWHSREVFKHPSREVLTA